jgi:hypothetical protein
LHDSKQFGAASKAKATGSGKSVAKSAATSEAGKNEAAEGEACSREADTARWWAVDLRALRGLASPVRLPALKAHPALAGLALLKQPRLSVQPVTAAEWAVILAMADGHSPPTEPECSSSAPPAAAAATTARTASGRKSSQVNTLPKAKSKTRSKQNKDMHKCSSGYSERGVPLPVLTSGGE